MDQTRSLLHCLCSPCGPGFVHPTAKALPVATTGFGGAGGQAEIIFALNRARESKRAYLRQIEMVEFEVFVGIGGVSKS